jgi:hypothetical protein
VQEENGSFNYAGGKTSIRNPPHRLLWLFVQIGIDPQSDEWTQSGGNPVTAMLSMQLSSGMFEHQKGIGSDGYATKPIPAGNGRTSNNSIRKDFKLSFLRLTIPRRQQSDWMQLISDINDKLPEDGSRSN